ncbi:MAG: sulfurtransferase TusA family protein [Candidatus Korarchaeota archaeon]
MSSSNNTNEENSLTNEIKVDRVIDARGFVSPLPLLRARAILRKMQPGQVAKLITTDKRTKMEVHIWGFNMGYKIIKTKEFNDVIEIYILKES